MAAHPLSDQELLAFLDSTPPRTGKLATVRADGRPHVAPIWYAVDRAAADGSNPLGDLVLNTGTDSLKGRNLRRDPRVSLCVDDDRPPFTFAVVEATATLSEDPDELLHWATVIGGRYMGAERAEEFGRRNGVPGELLVRLRPVSVVAVADVSD